MRNYTLFPKIILFLLCSAFSTLSIAQNEIAYKKLNLEFGILKDSVWNMRTNHKLSIPSIKDKLDFGNLSKDETEVMIPLLKNYGFRRSNSMKNSIESRKEIKKAINKSSELFPKNHYINIIIYECELKELPYEKRFEKYDNLINLCIENKINPSKFYKDKGKNYHSILRLEMKKWDTEPSSKMLKNPTIINLIQQTKKNYAEAISIAKNPGNSCDARNNIAVLHEDIGEYKNALIEHKKNLKLRLDYYKTNNNKHVAISDFNIGSVLSKMGKYNKANQHFKKFVEYYHFNNYNKVNAYIKIANFYAQMDSITMASENYFKAIAVLDKIKVGLGSDDATENFIKSGKKAHTQIMDFAIKHDAKLAFAVSERSRAIGLEKQLVELAAKKNAGIPVDILKREDSLKKEILSCQEKLDKSHSLSENEIKNTERLVSEYIEKLDELIINMKDDYPFFYNPETKNIQEIRKSLLNDSTSLIEYYLETNKNGKIEKIFIIRIDSESIDTAFIDATICNKIDSLINDFYLLTSHRDSLSNENNSKYFCDISHQLYQILIQSVEKKNPLKNNVYFIPQGKLNLISFDALIKTKTSDEDLYNPDYFIKHHTSSYGYSATILEQNSRFNPTATAHKNFLGIAPINFNHKSNLPNSKQEIESYIEIFGNDSIRTLFYNNASKINFEKHYKNTSYDIIHLATHAEANNSMTRIIFQDTFMNLEELYSTNIQAKLVILSACETGIGKYHAGEGVMSLARGFMYAGSPSTISSLWNVNDAAAQEIMISFYQNLNDGQRKDKALHNAKIKYLNTHNSVSPFIWASLIHIGNNQPLYPNDDYWILFFIFSALTAWGLYYLVKEYLMKD